MPSYDTHKSPEMYSVGDLNILNKYLEGKLKGKREFKGEDISKIITSSIKEFAQTKFNKATKILGIGN